MHIYGRFIDMPLFFIARDSASLPQRRVIVDLININRETTPALNHISYNSPAGVLNCLPPSITLWVFRYIILPSLGTNQFHRKQFDAFILVIYLNTVSETFTFIRSRSLQMYVICFAIDTFIGKSNKICCIGTLNFIIS